MLDNFDWLDDERVTETDYQLEDSRLLKRKVKDRRLVTLKKQHASEFISELPKASETWHIISNAKYDFWTWTPVFIDLLGGAVNQLYGSTWTMSRGNVENLLELYDDQKIANITILTGVYFKRRETAVFATLLEGIEQRKQRYIAFENHAKVLLLERHPDYIVIEGSANFTSNPRLEQYTISNDQRVYEFHRGWMEDIFRYGKLQDRA